MQRALPTALKNIHGSARTGANDDAVSFHPGPVTEEITTPIPGIWNTQFLFRFWKPIWEPLHRARAQPGAGISSNARIIALIRIGRVGRQLAKLLIFTSRNTLASWNSAYKDERVAFKSQANPLSNPTATCETA
jgi:hypothetical protein